MRKGLVSFLATGLGLGYLPKAPGTFGTLLGLILAIVLPDNFYLLAGVCILGIWISNEAEQVFNEHDCPKIVIDEIAGFLIAAYGWHGSYLVAAFVLFRILDITKPFPVRQLQNLPGGLGVMADDLAAGLIVNILLILANIVF